MLIGATLQDGYERRVIGLVAQMLSRKYKNTTITADTQLRSQLGIDSLAMLSLLFSFEKEFKVDMSQVDLAPLVGRLKTIRDLIEISQEVLESGGQVKASE